LLLLLLLLLLVNKSGAVVDEEAETESLLVRQDPGQRRQSRGFDQQEPSEAAHMILFLVRGRPCHAL
jgi:hypothetical protein